MTINPLPGRLLVRLEPPPERIGRLFVPNSFQRQPWETAVVLAVNEKEERIKPGDRILIPHGTGMTTTDTDDVIGLRREDVAALID